MPSGARVLKWLLLLASSACHHTEPAQGPAPVSRPRVAQRCPELLVARSADATRPRVFVEIAQLTGELGGPTHSAAPPPASPFDDPRLEVNRVAHVLATNDVKSTLAWDALSKTMMAESTRWDLSVTPHLEGTTPSAVRLELDLAPAPPLGTPPENWIIPEHRRVHTTVMIAEQQPVVLGLPRDVGTGAPSVMVVTPYVIREQADLRRLFECKLRGRRSASASF
jgi:hypothetical protein